MTQVRHALIIGAGIAGTATAMALRKIGVESTIYEAHPATADGVGVFLTLGSNGINALRLLEADAPVTAVGFPTPGITLRSHTGKRLGESSTGLPLEDGTFSHTMKRSDLYRVLLNEATRRGIRVEFGKRLVAAEPLSDGVRARFADGTEAVGDLLIGCDGVHSTVRRLIDPAAPAPHYTGLLTTGGYVSGLKVQSVPGQYDMIFGKRAFFGYVTAPDSQVWWFANVPSPEEPGRGSQRDGEMWRRRLIDLYVDDNGPAVRLIEKTDRISPVSPIHTIPKLPTWYRDRMIVIGDAAHAPSPTSGQGASLSIEDAVELAKCLRDSANVSDAFARFVAERRPRVERIIQWAARMNSNKAPGPIARMIRDLVLPMILKGTANSKDFRDIYEYRLDWGASGAMVH